MKPRSSDSELERALAAAVDAGRDAFPELSVPPETFASYLSERLADDADPVDQLASLAVADLYLACACHLDLPGAIAAFEAKMAPVLRQVHARTRMPFDELVQRLRIHLFVGGAIATYRGKGRLSSWLRVTGTRSAHRWEQDGANELAVTRDELVAIADSAADPQVVAFRTRYRGALADALESALAELEPRERRFLRYRYVHGLEVAAIAKIYGVHRVTASRILARATERISEATRARLGQQLELREHEIDSVIQGLWSELDIRLTQLLRSSPDRSG